MIGDASIFQKYRKCKEDYSIRIADGSLSKVTRTGFVNLSPNLTFCSILHVPNLDCNLLSVSKLCEDLNCATKFVSNMCEFQDLDSGRMIDNDRMSSGLYLLQINASRRQTHNAVCANFCVHTSQ